MRYPVVLCDLDGTLIDSGAMILSSFRHATSTVLQEDVSDERLLAAVGAGASLHEQLERFGSQHLDALVHAYRAHNEPLHRDLTACAGVLDLLNELRADGRRLGIVTAKRHATVRLAFEVLPLEPLFDVVVASEDTERHKPDPAPIVLALDRLGARPEDAAYVGDSPFDVRSARAAGVTAIAVTWGGLYDAERLAGEEPHAVVGSARELRELLL
jgi:pyrophosphatase PpaX